MTDHHGRALISRVEGANGRRVERGTRRIPWKWYSLSDGEGQGDDFWAV